MTKRERKPRAPMLPGLPATFAQAEATEILATMTDWPERIARALNAGGWGDGLNDREAGHRLWQAKFELELMNSRNPDTLATIVYLAEHGHVAARRALERYTTYLLEDPKAELPTSVRTYLIRLMKGLVPAHPQDKSEMIDRLVRDIGVAVMVDAAAARWSLPKLHSSAQRRSAAHFVAVIMTECGSELGERQVRRICEDRGRLAQRMGKFLVGEESI
jgi:hypothetical protein